MTWPTPTLVSPDAGAAPELQDDTEVPVIQAASADCLFLLNTTSSIAHVAAVCDESDPYRVVTVDAGEVRKSFKFACNVRRAAWDAEIIPAETFPEKFRLCMRPACSKTFD